MDGSSPPHSDSPLPCSDASVVGNPNSAQSSPPLTQPPPLLRPAPPSAPPSLLRQPPPLQTRPLQNRTPHNHPPPPLIRPAVASSLHQGALRNSLSSSSASAGQLPPSLVGLKVESPQSHWLPRNIRLFILVFRRPNSASHLMENLVSNQCKRAMCSKIRKTEEAKLDMHQNARLASQVGWTSGPRITLHIHEYKPQSCQKTNPTNLSVLRFYSYTSWTVASTTETPSVIKSSVEAGSLTKIVG